MPSRRDPPLLTALLIAAKDLRLRLRDRSVFIIGLVAPLALATIFNLVFGNLASEQSFQPSYGVVDLDEGALAEQFGATLQELADDGLFQLEPLGSIETARARAGDDIDAVFVVPQGLSDAVQAGRAGAIEVVGNVDSPTSTQIATAIAEGFAGRVERAQITAAAATVLGRTDAGALAERAGRRQILEIRTEQSASRLLDPGNFFAAGMAVFFLFFTVQFGVVSLLDESREGTMQRLLSAPVKRWTILAGKAVSSLVIGTASMLVLIGASALLFGSGWGSPVGVGLLILAGVLAAVGVQGLVASFARTPEAAGNLGAIVAVVLGFLGGTFIPVPGDGGALSVLAQFTPHYWFLRGLGDLAGGDGWYQVLGEVVPLLLFAVVTAGIATPLLSRRLVR